MIIIIIIILIIIIIIIIIMIISIIIIILIIIIIIMLIMENKHKYQFIKAWKSKIKTIRANMKIQYIINFNNRIQLKKSKLMYWIYWII